MRTQSRGFTQLEMIMVLAVAGTTMGMAVPEITSIISHARVNHAASIAAGDLELASSLAFRVHKPLRLTIDATAMTITVSDRATGTVLSKRQFGSRTDFKLTTFAAVPAQVDVFPNGSATQSLTLTLGLPGYSRVVTLSRAGMVQGAP